MTYEETYVSEKTADNLFHLSAFGLSSGMVGIGGLMHLHVPENAPGLYLIKFVGAVLVLYLIVNFATYIGLYFAYKTKKIEA